MRHPIHYHESDKGRINNFVVQLEMNIKGEWKTVVRYDCTHSFSDFIAMLSSEFHLYIREHNGQLPKNALVIFSVEGDNDFNKWHKEISLKNREPGQPLVYVHLKKWRRLSSIDKVEMQTA